MTSLYYDHNATTPLHPEVAEAMRAFILDDTGSYGNPSSIHSQGRKARSKVEDVREAIANWIEVSPTEIAFTSGGTEADNLALFGATGSGKLPGRHLVTSTFEHAAVLESFRKLERENWEVSWVDPDEFGFVNADEIEKLLRPDTGLVSLMCANNEVGTVQSIEKVGALLKKRGILFHSDGVQALGKVLEIKPRKWGVDYMAFSAHKINGPKGIGALYIRKGAPMQGVALGGSQERGFRGGTENVLGIVGFGKAVEIAMREGALEMNRVKEIRDALEKALCIQFPDLIVNGLPGERLPNTLNVTLLNCSADMMVMGLDMRGIAVSAGSACASGSVKFSHVLLAMGKNKDIASSSLRFSLGLGNKLEDIPIIVKSLNEVASAIRGITP